MRVVHTVASLHADAGGPSRTVSAVCEALAQSGTNVNVIAVESGDPEKSITPSGGRTQTEFVKSTLPGLNAWRFGRHVRRRLQATGASLVHDHGVWLLTNYATARAARAAGVPYVVTTRGMLEPWALNHHSWRKRLAWYGYQRRILQRAALLHATAPMEAEHLRELGLTAPIAVIPNGVPLPDTWKREPSPGSNRKALFLSRIHPKKGLPNLIDAWANVRPENWELLIVGPDEDGHRREVEYRVKDCGLSEDVSFHGPVADDEKWTLYRESDLFLLPTYSENFGVVVGEALASGIPALTTTGAPWSILEDHECGWWVEPAVDSLEMALSEAVSRSDEERLAMGQRGRSLVEDQFSWRGVAKKMKAAYRWILDGGPRPDFIRVD